jgi:CheY-like chemotaxis protein
VTTTTTIAARTVSVLIIEDDIDTADSLARFLRFGCGYFVATARDGLNGVRIAVENQPDVVVCDIGLPKKNGLLVAEELAEFLPRPLLIAVTGFGDQVSQGLAEAVGFDHFLLKPADPFRIKALIDGEAESLRDRSSALPAWPSGRPGPRSSRPAGPSPSIHDRDDGAGVPPGRPGPSGHLGPEPILPGHESVAGPEPRLPDERWSHRPAGV